MAFFGPGLVRYGHSTVTMSPCASPCEAEHREMTPSTEASSHSPEMRSSQPSGDQGMEVSPGSPQPSVCESEDTTCAICFESRQFVKLPCACTTKYCGPCWDRALAASVTVRGRAQCPSCRMALRVDYNADAESLVFSKETERATLAQWRQRLYKKARPVQIRLLQEYGRQRVEQARRLEKCGEPLCVCGDVLEKIDGNSRVVRMLEDTEPGWRSRVHHDERLVHKLAMSSLITCDLCDEVAMRTGYVWTCKNGPHTVLHPAAYDVCEQCFNNFSASGAKEAQKADQSTGICLPPLTDDGAEAATVGCNGNVCTGAIFRGLRWPRSPANSPTGARRSSSMSGRARSAMNNMVRGFHSSLPKVAYPSAPPSPMNAMNE